MHPNVEVVDLDPDAWGAVANAVVRGRAIRPWIHVLHLGGQILSVAGASFDPALLPAVGAVVGAPQTFCDRLRNATGADRVVVIDREHLADIVRQVTIDARVDMTLPQFRFVTHRAFWGSPGVVTSPNRPVWRWESVRLAMAGLPDRVCVRVSVTRGGRPWMSLTATIEGGLLTRISGSASEGVLSIPDATVEWQEVVAALEAAEPAHAMAELIIAGPHSSTAAVLARAVLQGSAWE